MASLPRTPTPATRAATSQLPRSKSATLTSVRLGQAGALKALASGSDIGQRPSLAALQLAARGDGAIIIRASSSSNEPIAAAARQPDATETGAGRAHAAPALLVSATEVRALPAVAPTPDDASPAPATKSPLRGAAARAAQLRSSAADLVTRAGRAVGGGLSCLCGTARDGMESFAYANQYYMPYPGGAWAPAGPVYPFGAF